MTGWQVDTGQGTTITNTGYDAFSDATVLDSGRIVATWCAYDSHYGPGHGETAYSDNKGLTWSTPQHLIAGVTHVGAVGVASLGNRVAVIHQSLDTPLRTAWLQLSTDGGETWGTPSQITGWGGAGWVFPSDILWHDNGTSDGLMLVTSYGAANGAVLMASTNAGATWTKRSTILKRAVWQDNSETGLCILPDGDLLALVRNDTTYQIEALRSTDMGLTWSAPTTAMRDVSGMPRPTVLPDGTILTPLRGPGGDGTGNNQRWMMGISTDNGDSWLPWNINDEWMMYGRFIVLNDDTVRLVGSSQERGTLQVRTWIREVHATTGVMVNGIPRTDPLMVDVDIINIPTPVDRIEILDGTTHSRITWLDVAGGSAYHPDYTAPVGEVTYLIRTYDATGTMLEEVSTTITTPEPPGSHVWLSDPLDETSPVLVPMLIDGDRQRPREANVSISRTVSGRVIASIGPTTLGEWVIVVKAINPEMIRRLQEFFTNASSLLIRAGTEMFLPGRMYAALPTAIEELRLYPEVPNGAWTLACVPADAPGIDPVISTWTWDALEAFCDAHNTTWDSLGDTFPTWIELERGPVGGA